MPERPSIAQDSASRNGDLLGDQLSASVKSEDGELVKESARTIRQIAESARMKELAELQVHLGTLLGENEKLKVAFSQAREELRVSQQMLEGERRLSRDLKSEKTNFYSRRNQLEELFLSCVEETRKDIERRRAVTLARTSNLNSNLHRNHNSAHTEEEALDVAIKNEQFTARDKRKVLELLLSNENVLLFLYEKLFPRALTTSTMINQTHLTGATENNYANLGFRPKTAAGSFAHAGAPSSHKLQSRSNARKSAKLSSKSMRNLSYQITGGHPIKFREMSAAPLDESAQSLPMSAATRSNSNLGLNPNKTSSSILTKNRGYLTGGQRKSNQNSTNVLGIGVTPHQPKGSHPIKVTSSF